MQYSDALRQISILIDEFLWQASRNIKWTDDMSETRFKDHIQYALPYLNREKMATKDIKNVLKVELPGESFKVEDCCKYNEEAEYFESE